MMLTEQTRRYWIDTLRGWAEERLSAPQFAECSAVLDKALATAEPLPEDVQQRIPPLIQSLRYAAPEMWPRLISAKLGLREIVALRRERDALVAELVDVLETAIARGESLGYCEADTDYEERLAELKKRHIEARIAERERPIEESAERYFAEQAGEGP